MRKYPDKNTLFTRLYGNNGVIMQKTKLVVQVKLKLEFKHYSIYLAQLDEIQAELDEIKALIKAQKNPL